MESAEKSRYNLEIALREYQKTTPLTEKEIGALPIYIRLAHAMHVLLASYHKYALKNNLPENEYFLKEGRLGLRQTA